MARLSAIIQWYNEIKHLWDWRETGYQILLWFGGFLFYQP